MESILRDLIYAVRGLAKNRGFAVAAISLLALGIGANSSIFTAVNAFVLRPLPIREPERMVEIYTSNMEGNPQATSSFLDYQEIRKQTHLFEGVTAYSLAITTLTVGGQPQVMLGELVSGNYFDVLGVKTTLGRPFLPREDATPGAFPVAVIGQGLWQRQFGSDPGVIGKTVTIGGIGFTIVGVAPPQFKGMIPGLSTDLWLPTMMLPQIRTEQPEDLDRRMNRGFFIKARLRDGVDIEQARAGLKVLEQRLEKEYPETNKGFHFSALPTSQVHFHPRVDRVLGAVSALLLVVVGLVLVVACTNVANLLLARASARQREMAVRLAIGASRGQIVRQLLVESTLLGLLGGGAGLLLALWLTRMLASFRPPLPIPLSIDLSIDLRVLLYTFGLALATGILFGLAPALRASKPDLLVALKSDDIAIGSGRRRFELRRILVVSQIALSLALLIGAGLFLRSLVRAQSLNPGFTVDRASVAWLNVGVQGYREEKGRAFYLQLLERAKGLPGVQVAALTDRLPLDLAAQSTGIYRDDQPITAETEAIAIDFARTSPGYFSALGIPFQSGRDFTMADGERAPLVAIVSQAAAQKLWPGEDVIGKRFRRSDPSAPPIEIVGVVKDTKVRSLGEPLRPYLYLPFLQAYEPAMQLIVSGPGDARQRLGPLRDLVHELDSSLNLFAVKTLREHMSVALFPVRMAAGLLGAFGVLALIIACVGVWGVTAYVVAQRRYEFSMRMALGADRPDILRLVMRQGVKTVGVGIALGLLFALALAPLLAGFVVGVSYFDPLTFLVIPVLLGGIAVLAVYVPGRRAAAVDSSRVLSSH